MCFASKPDSVRRERTVAVDWHDCAWSPPITVQMPSPERGDVTKRLPALPSILHTARCHPADLKIMKTILPSSRRHRAGFTLVELLVVIAIIAILAALLLPVISSAIKHAKMAKAKTEEVAIVAAVEAYDSAYGRLPVSRTAQNAASSASGDFTYGTTGVASATFSLPTSYAINANNSDVVAILMNITTYPGTSNPTVNTNSQSNPKQTGYLNAHMSGDTNSPGVGTDLVYRDPWGNPYIISMDLNYDEQTKDAFYSQQAVSVGGINGLVDPTDPTGADNNYQFHGKVMVWSAGPDGKIDVGDAANKDENKDNVTSW